MKKLEYMEKNVRAHVCVQSVPNDIGVICREKLTSSVGMVLQDLSGRL